MGAPYRLGLLGMNPGHGDPPGPSAIDDRWCRPGPLGVEASATRLFHGRPLPVLHLPLPCRQVARARPQELRQGSRGLEVQRLQRQLNARSLPSPGLRVDGIFGPVTHQAVLQYQHGLSLPADGIAGKRTWYHLLKKEKAVVPGASTSTPLPTSAGAPGVVSRSAATTARPSASGPSSTTAPPRRSGNGRSRTSSSPSCAAPHPGCPRACATSSKRC
jgi:hypothetical protein